MLWGFGKQSSIVDAPGPADCALQTPDRQDKPKPKTCNAGCDGETDKTDNRRQIKEWNAPFGQTCPAQRFNNRIAWVQRQRTKRKMERIGGASGLDLPERCLAVIERWGPNCRLNPTRQSQTNCRCPIGSPNCRNLRHTGFPDACRTLTAMVGDKQERLAGNEAHGLFLRQVRASGGVSGSVCV